ncbi:MAG: thioredoxin [Deltaproteobacteria bacterium]|jgi:thioredoxin 1
MPTVEITDANFESAVLQSELPVLLDFWATWCAPCKAVAPVLEELSEQYAGKLVIGKLDVDASPQTAQMFGIRSIPTLVLMDQGKPVKAVQGAQPKEALVELIESNVAGLRAPTVKPEELAALMQRGMPIVVFDLRDPRDVSRSHLRHAKTVAADALPAAIAEADPRSLVVLVCRTGEISSEAAAKIGQPNVVAIEKGLLEWEGAGFETFSDREEAELDAG